MGVPPPRAHGQQKHKGIPSPSPLPGEVCFVHDSDWDANELSSKKVETTKASSQAQGCLQVFSAGYPAGIMPKMF